jgi:hypothetical protein
MELAKKEDRKVGWLGWLVLRWLKAALKKHVCELKMKSFELKLYDLCPCANCIDDIQMAECDVAGAYKPNLLAFPPFYQPTSSVLISKTGVHQQMFRAPFLLSKMTSSRYRCLLRLPCSLKGWANQGMAFAPRLFSLEVLGAGGDVLRAPSLPKRPTLPVMWSLPRPGLKGHLLKGHVEIGRDAARRVYKSSSLSPPHSFSSI